MKPRIWQQAAPQLLNLSCRCGHSLQPKPVGTRMAKPEISVESLTQEEAAAELARLAEEIAGHDRRYHAEDAPTVSDAEYDALKLRNAAIEARFPELMRDDSPSRAIGAAPSGAFAQVRHSRPMLSL